MDSKDIRALCEAYAAVYDEDLRNEVELFSEDDLSFIDDLSDNELDQVMEEVLSEGLELSECFEAFDQILTEARVDMAARAAARKQYMKQSEKSAKEARSRGAAKERSERRAERAERIKSSAKRAAEKVKTTAAGAASAASAGASEASRKAKEGAKKVGGKLHSAKEKVKGFVKKVGKAAKAGYSAAKKEFSGEAERESKARVAGRQMRRAARSQAAAERGRDTSAFQKKSSKKPSDPWAGSATKPPSRSSSTTKTTRALSGSSVKGALPPAKESGRKQAAKAKLAKAAAGSSAKGIRFAGKTSGQVASQRAHTGVKGALDKFRKKAGISEEIFNSILDYIFEDLVNEGYAYNYDHAFDILESVSFDLVADLIESYLPESEEVETVDLYDVVMDYLLDEGYAETEESAEVIMVNMSEEWRDEILEATYSAKSARAGKDIGKPGKQFAKIAKEAGKRYGSKERGEKVAGAVLAKLRARKG